MTLEHIFFIPIVFLSGFAAGIFFFKRRYLVPANVQVGKRTIPPSAIRNTKIALVIFLTTFVTTHFFTLPYSSKAIHSSLGSPIFDKKASFGKEEVYERISKFNPVGIEDYKVFAYSTDVIFPLALFILMMSIYRLVQFQMSKHSFIFIAPILWLLADFVENIIIFNLLVSFPVERPFLAEILGIVTYCKFALLLISVFIPIIVLSLSKRP
jgi:hypothetical protein